MSVLAHVGGVAIEESLIYLLPPLAVVAWIYVLGRRERRDPRPPPDPDDEELDAPPPAAGRQAATGEDDRAGQRRP